MIIQILNFTNGLTNSLCSLIFAPIAHMVGWLSITIISAVLGVLLLVIFKYTSNQKAITRVRDDIKANLLAIKLYRENFTVTIRSQTQVFCCSFKLLYYAIIPMLIMIVPVSLLLAQMGQWYQFSPLQADGSEYLVKLTLNSTADVNQLVALKESPAAKTVLGPVRVKSTKEIYWKIAVREMGYHNLTFTLGNVTVEKQMAIGDGLMRISPMRPGPSAADVLLYPMETPFKNSGPVRSITIEYPERESYIHGTDWWILYFFIMSMAAAFLFKPFLKVRI